MGQYTKYNPDQHAKDKAIVLALIAELGPVPRSDIWQALHGRVTVNHVDQALATLLREGRGRATKANLAKPVEGQSKSKWVVPYTATVYEAVTDRVGIGEP